MAHDELLRWVYTPTVFSPKAKRSGFAASRELDSVPVRDRPAPLGVVKVPSAAQRLIEPHDRDELVDLHLCQRRFRRKKELLRLEHLVVRGLAGIVALRRDLH